MPGAVVVAGGATLHEGSVQVPPHSFALLGRGG
jgi:hypothetical protein